MRTLIVLVVTAIVLQGSNAGIAVQLQQLKIVQADIEAQAVAEKRWQCDKCSTVYRYTASAIAIELSHLESGRDTDNRYNLLEVKFLIDRLSEWLDLLTTIPGSMELRNKLTDRMDDIEFELSN